MIEHTLADTLRKSMVRIDEPDADTICLRGVPVNTPFFNKARTNLLIKRPREGLPFLVCVDEDLEYTGADPDLARVFAGRGNQRGWRVLSLAPEATRAAGDVIDDALAALGFDGREPALKTPDRRASVPPCVLDSYGTSLSRLVASGLAEPCVGRRNQIEEAVCCLAQHRPSLPLIVGASGIGKTNLLHGVARALADLPRATWDLVLVDLGALFSGTLFHAERETRLADLLDAAPGPSGSVVLALEHLELVPLEVPHGSHLLSQALDRGVRAIGTTLPEYVNAFNSPALARRLQFIELAPLVPDDAYGAVLGHRDRIAAHHGLAIEDTVVRAALESAQSLAGTLPAAAIALLDTAAARAALAGDAEVGLPHLYMAASRLAGTAD